MSYSLVIIDMQRGFPAACNERTLKAVIREIRQAKRNNRIIFVVELSSDICCAGLTHENIRRAYCGYDHVYKVEKFITDGTWALTTPAAEKDGYGPSIPEITKCKRLRIVGVNTDCCVQATALGLKKKGYKVEVVSDACHSQFNHLGGLEAMRRQQCRMLRLAHA